MLLCACVLHQVGWPPPIATAADPRDNDGAAAAPADAKSAARVFVRAQPPLLTALRQLLAAMFALQRADDPRSFAKVRAHANLSFAQHLQNSCLSSETSGLAVRREMTTDHFSGICLLMQNSLQSMSRHAGQEFDTSV